MVRHRLGEREVGYLVHLGRQGYVLVPAGKEERYRSLERKGCVAITAARSHKTLRSGTVVVDIWRIALTPRGEGVAATLERDSQTAHQSTAEDVTTAETVALDMAALFDSYDETEDYL